MKYILIMQLILSGYKEGGAAVETVTFDSLEDCQKVKSTFLMSMKVNPRLEGVINRKAECVIITGEE